MYISRKFKIPTTVFWGSKCYFSCKNGHHNALKVIVGLLNILEGYLYSAFLFFFPVFLWPSSLLTGDTLTVMGLSINGKPGAHRHIPPAWTCSCFWCCKINCWSQLCRTQTSCFPSTFFQPSLSLSFDDYGVPR